MARLVCHVEPTAAGVTVTWSDGPAAFAPFELPAKPLAAAAAAARAALGGVVEAAAAGDAGPDAGAAAAALAAAGYGLYQALFKPAAEHLALASEVRKWLDALHAEGAVEALEVVAEGGVAVPWNLVYDRRPDPAAFNAGGDDPARWRPFWGLRYDLSGGRRVSPLRRLPVLQDPRVVVVTDPLVLDRLADEARDLAALCREQGWPHARTRDELAAALAAGRPDVLYWLGHTQTDPFGLVLGDDVVTPDDLKALLEGDPFADPGRVFGGVAFLNACGTAVAGPGGSFLDALHPLGLTGYVATEQVTVDTFAAPLGREFLAAFAAGGEPLGRVMRGLRGRVPLGLVYGSYCPPTVRVRRDPAAAADGGPIVLTRPTAGTTLRREAHAPTAEARPLPPRPYRSLRAYGPDDRALFAGRDDDALRFAQLLDDPGTRLVVLHGESGVGKTSFLQAGVVPFLERECVGYRFARDRAHGDGETVLVVRATNDPVGQVAGALAAVCGRPLAYRTPAGAEAAADLPAVLRAATGGAADLRAALRGDPGLLGRVLADLGRRLPFTPVLVIDQAEEVFTLARTAEDEANRAAALEMLRRAAAGPGGFKLVVSLRTEYHGRFADALRKGTRPTTGVRDYLLTDFGAEALTGVILRPTSPTPVEHAAEVPAEKYGFRYAPGVAAEVARRARAYTVHRQDSVLPLVQVVCTQLYDRVRDRADRVVTAADLEAIGGVEGGMRAHAEALVAKLFPRRADRAAFRKLASDPRTQLFLRQADGTLTTALLPADFLARHWAGRMPFEEVLRTAGAGEWRLLRVNSLRIGGDRAERPYVSLGHDALAKVVARWQEDRQRAAHRRRYAYAAAGVALLVAAGFAVQAREARLALATADRHTRVRDRFAALYTEAEQAVNAPRLGEVPWAAVAATLDKADQVVAADPAAFADYPLRKSADELRGRADAALAGAARRAAERDRFDRLAARHREAVVFGSLAVGLGEAETRARVRAAVAAGLDAAGVDPKGAGPPTLVKGFFTDEEWRTAVSRCYELLLHDADAVATATPEKGETVGDLRARTTAALALLDRADRLGDGTATRSGLDRRTLYLLPYGGLWARVAAAAADAKARNTVPVLATDYYLLALDRFHRREIPAAVSHAAAAVRADPDHYGARYLLALCHLHERRPEPARAALEWCLARQPDLAWPRLYLAMVETRLARADPRVRAAAEDTLGRLVRDAADPGVRYVALSNRGVLAYERGDWAAAEADLRAAIRLRPDAPPAYLSLAITLRDRPAGLPPAVAAWGLVPGGTAGFATAACEHRRRTLGEAAAVLTTAIETEAIRRQGGTSPLYRERARVHRLQGSPERATADLLAAVLWTPTLGVSPAVADDFLELGLLQHEAGRFADAARVYQIVLATENLTVRGEQKAEAARRLAEALLARRHFTEAALAIEAYLALTPVPTGTALPPERAGQLAAVLKAQGLIHAELKNLGAAVDSFTRSLVYARDPEVLTLRGGLYLTAGAAELAVRDFDDALEATRADPATAVGARLGRAEARLRLNRVPEGRADARAAEAEIRNLPAGTRPQTRLRLRLAAARVFAQLTLAEPDPDAAADLAGRTAALLRLAVDDVTPDRRPSFWRESVLTDPSLGRLSGGVAMTRLAAEFGPDPGHPRAP